MLQIEIKEKLDDSSGFKEFVVINSLEDIDSFLTEYGDGYKSAYFYDEDVILELLKYSPKEVGLFLDTFRYSKVLEDLGFLVEIEFHCKNDSIETPAHSAKMTFLIDFVNWNKPYSIAEFSEEMSIMIKADENPLYEFFEVDDEIITNGFGFEVTLIDENSILSEIERTLINYADNLLDTTIASIISKLDANVLVTYFDFPDPIKTACKQYLVYFAQFLMDIGIDVETEIKEDAHKTLFKIIPNNNNESLELIKNALDVYLRMPNVDDLTILKTENSNDISIMQLQANVLHLKSQLLIASSVMQLKDATIEQLQLSNYQYKNSLQGNIIKNEIDKEEEVIKGILSVKKYDGKGFTVNFAEILRRMKRKFY